jgi:cell division topological specificity factor
MSTMNLFNQFIQAFQKKSATAPLAKERLQIIVSHERLNRNGPDYLPLLKKELLDVIAKYIPVQEEQVKVDIERTGNNDMLALNITLPDRPPIAGK